MLFHITTRAAWAEAQRDGVYRAPSLATEGFIHLSTGAQWRETAARFFRGATDLVLLELNESLLGPVKYEPADGQHFPHLYAELSCSAVVATRRFEVSAEGAITEH